MAIARYTFVKISVADSIIFEELFCRKTDPELDAESYPEPDQEPYLEPDPELYPEPDPDPYPNVLIRIQTKRS
jgi:hypothetical protein